MNLGLIYIILLCIWNSLLFYDNLFGVNVLLFSIPLLIYLFYILKINKLIKNKWGLLFMIPIVLLSITYLLYTNVFNTLNYVAIPCLYGLMYIYTMKPTFNIQILLDDLVKIFIMPFDFIERYIKYFINKFSISLKLSETNKKKIKSILIVLPIVLIVLILLSSADMIFNNLFSGVFKVLDNISFSNIISRLIIMIILFIYLGSSIYYLINKYSDNETITTKEIKIDDYTIKLLLTLLNIIYIVFDIIQIRSLLLHRVSSDIVYSEYARQGFFQLMFISLINLTILLLSHNSKKNNYNKYMYIGMFFLTLIIIMSSIYRMYLYESQYGYTVLRLGVYTILFSEIILLIPTVIYILKDKFNILKYYMIICISIYTLINFVSVDFIIAKNNINRYYRTGKIDLDYLENYKYDNVELLYRFYTKVDDKEIKENLHDYFEYMKDYLNNDNIFEYNISRDRARKIIK